MSLVELPRDMSHAAVRRRLLNPPNAVRDRGIDLKRKRRVEPPPPPPPPPPDNVVDLALMRLIREAERIEKMLGNGYPLGFPIEQRLMPTVAVIQQIVAVFYKISVGDLWSQRRTADAVLPRHIAMYLAKTLTLRTLPDIGRRFGGRDHTTVLHAVRKITALLETDERLRDEVQLIIMRVRELLGEPP